MRWSVLLSAVLYLACASRAGLVNQLTSAEAMRAAVLARAPVGTPLASATAFLASEGFVCGTSQRSTFATSDTITFAYCDARSTGGITFRRWQLAVLDSAGVVQDVRVTTGLVGP